MPRTAFVLLLLAWGATGQDAGAPSARTTQEGRDCETAEGLRAKWKASPGDASLWNLLGLCESRLNHPDEARAAFERGLEIEPKSTSLHENLGLLYYRQGNYPAARLWLEKAVSLGSTNAGARFSLAASRIRTGDEQKGLAELRALEPDLAQTSGYWSERGWAEFHTDPARAATSFDRALALDPSNLRALQGAASAAEANGADEKALSFLLTARRSYPDDLNVLLHFGVVCLRRNLSADALDALEHARQSAPANNLALFLTARAHVACRHWQQAHDLFAAYLDRVPGDASAPYAMGWLDRKRGLDAEAREHLEQCLSLAPSQADARYELARLDMDEGQMDDAAGLLADVLEKDPRHMNANVAMGDLLLKLGNPREARAHYETALSADPQSGPVHNKLSTVLLQMDDRERAEEERALGAKLNAEPEKKSTPALLLPEPDGTLLSGEAHP